MKSTAKRILIILFVLWPLACWLLFFTPSTSKAIPAFAHKYGKSCNTCHSAVPKLNDFGERVRANGYQLPGEIDDTPVWAQPVLPFSAMAHAMYMNMQVENKMEVEAEGDIPEESKLDVSSFRYQSAEFFMGGTAGRNLSYLVFMEVENEPELEEGIFETHTEIAFHQAYGMYNNLIPGTRSGEMNLRFGLFELEVPFSHIRLLSSESAKYLVNGITPFEGGFNLNQPQVGFSVKGRVANGFEYEAATVNGTNTNFDTNDWLDLYFRAAYKQYELIPGLAGLRLGGFYYLGQQNLGTNVAPDNTAFRRFGGDVLLEFRPGFDFFGQFLYGKDDDTDPASLGEQTFKYWGGFAETDIHNLIHRNIVPFFRYEYVKVKQQWDLAPLVVDDTGDQDKIQRILAGVRVYLSPNFFTLLEAGWQDNNLGYPESANGAGRVVNVDRKWGMAMLGVAF